MKYIQYVFGLLLFIGVVIGGSIYLFRQKKQTENINIQLSKVKEQLFSERLYNSTIKTCREFEMFFNGKNISLNSTIIGEKDSIIYLKDVVYDNSIILRYSELHCNTCVNAMIEKLTQYSNYIGSKNIVLLLTSATPNYIRQLKKLKKNKFSVYNLTQNLENLFNDVEFPYFFIIEKSTMRINSAFIPQKEYPELIDKYFENIIKEYFE